MKMEGTVLEINSETALVMTSKCDFVEIYRRDGLEAGQEIIFSRRDVVRKGKRTGRLTLALVACLALFFICIPVYISFFTGTAGAAVAYVSLDINPSLELAVNDRYKVLEATALNKDGDKLLQSVSVQGKPIADAVEALIKAAEEMQYLSPDGQGQVLVCLAPAESLNQNAKLLSNIDDQLVNLGKSNATTKIKIVGTTNIQHQEAQQVGMSAGRYALWKKTAKGDQGKLEQYKSGKLADVIAEPKGNSNRNGNKPKLGNGKGNGNGNGNSAAPSGKPNPNSGQDAKPVTPPGLDNKGVPGLESRGQDLESENKLGEDKPTGGNNAMVNKAGNSTGQQKIENHNKGKDAKNKDTDLVMQIKRNIKAKK
ncbi:MAG TPA: hypothetical protein DEF34_02880 [Desulfotomaculum sp.]|nr:MAG: hypothetical protein VR67_14690 [Peptococcaceae bacterium BRH_c8a]KJS77630.1 MAG: hypothetical protein JL56_02505 [Desulfotomaculum sp. BICA1-6]HBX22571.1 hypothetical protein [Desulfotomaculum sp.]